MFCRWQNTRVDVEFADAMLENAFRFRAVGTRAWGEIVARAYQRRVTFLFAAANRRQLRDQRSLRLHQLAPPHAGRFSMVLHGRWRLIISFEGDTVRVEEVSNHYGD